MKRKWLAVGIILLFVGVTIAPTINFNTVKASTDDDLVEVTTQACGIKGYGNTTVKLTREQYQNLEEYLVEFRARLNQTSTREEAVPIFKEAVVELDKYGLLPRGMNVAQAQKLVIGVEPKEKIQKCIQKFLDRIQRGNPNNTFCLLAGNVDDAIFWSFMTIISGAAMTAFIFLATCFPQIIWLLTPMNTFFFGLFGYSVTLKPFHILSKIDISPTTSGTINSFGVSGPYNISGQFGGTIRGFTGIRFTIIHPDPYDTNIRFFFLGSAVSMTVIPNQ
jgi:hypothetical protein